MNNAVIYARYSTSHQREESIAGQIRECRTYAERNGLNVIKIYTDKATSGRTDNRPEFKQMIADSQNHSFNTILVYSFDRFSRNNSHYNKYKNILKENGVTIYSVIESQKSPLATIILNNIYEWASEYNSTKTAIEVHRGMEENALGGKWTSGPVPFGFARDENKKLVKHPVTNKFLYDICKMYDEGANFIDLERYLKSHNIKNNLGRDFNKDSFRRILTSPINIGIFKWHDVVIKDYLEPTIPVDMYNRIQKRLSDRQQRKNVNVIRSDKFLLTPHIFCAECGGMMNGMSGRSATGTVHYYYACANKRRKFTDCDINLIPRDKLEDAIYGHTINLLSNSANIDAIAEEACAAHNAFVDNELLALQQRERQLKKVIENYMKAIEIGTSSVTILQRLEASEKEVKALKASIERRKLLSPNNVITKQHIAFFLKHIASLSKEEGKGRILQALVNKVIVGKNKDSNGEYTITVHFNYSNTPKLDASLSFNLSDKK